MPPPGSLRVFEFRNPKPCSKGCYTSSRRRGMSGLCANPLFQPQCPLARSGGRQHNCRLGFGPRAIGDEIADCARKSGRLKKTSLLEKCRIRCSDDVGAGRGHAQPFGDRRERVVGETTAIVVSSAGFIAAPTFEAPPRSAGQPFWGRESACGESAKRKRV